MTGLRTLLQRRLVTALLLPIVAAGILAWALSYYLISQSLTQILGQRAADDLTHAVQTTLTVCEERFDDLLSLRMEDDAQANASMRRQAVEEMIGVARAYAGIEVAVLEKGRLVNASLPLGQSKIHLPLKAARTTVARTELDGRPVLFTARYFPFWRWHIVTFIFEEDYQAPIHLARRMVTWAIAGVLLVIIGTVFLMVTLRINRPLAHLRRASRKVAAGTLTPSAVVTRDEIGQVAEAFNAMIEALARDRQTIRQMMSELRDSEEQYRVLTEKSLAHIVVIQSDRIVYANQRCLETLDYDLAALRDIAATDLIHAKDRDRIVRMISSLQKGETEGTHFEGRFMDRAGRPIWFETLATAIVFRDKSAVVVHAINIERRKTEALQRRMLEQKLIRAQKMEAIGALAGSVAHDLNNILGGLVTYPELLLMDIAPDNPLHSPLSMIQQAGQRAAAIVQDMLTLARRGVNVTEVVGLDEVVHTYRRSPEYQRLMTEHPRVRVEVRVDAEVASVVGSPVHLSKTVMNLMTNAVEAIEQEGRVTLAVSSCRLEAPLDGYETIPPGHYVRLTVKDNGTGIAATDLKKIFEPFYSKKVMGRSGTGLGMAVVWSTVKDHQGFIDVNSEKSRGTRFDLYFPASRQPTTTPAPAADLSRFQGSETILVVDDVPEQRQVGRHLLEKLGYRVLEAQSGEQAVDLLQDQSADLVVLDMIMDPGIDGLETYRRILALRPGQKAVIASGYSETARVKEALALGAAGYVRKPYLIQTLGQAVRDALDQSGTDPAHPRG